MILVELQVERHDAMQDLRRLCVSCAGALVAAARAMKPFSPLALTTVLVLGGCVSQGRYDEAVATTRLTRAELEKTERLLQQTNQRLQQSGAELEDRNAQITARQEEIAKLKSEIERLVQLDRKTTGEQMQRISDLRRRLAELETAQRAAEQRAAVFKELTLKLKKQIDDGDLELVIRDGRMVLLLPNDVLFDTGRTELKPAGRKALEAVGAVMTSMPTRHFQVSGHTDNVPIHNAAFPSNWELSTGRALRVLHFLVGQGVADGNLSAAGYSEIDPVATNGTVEGRKKNRRTEITLQPNIDELVKIPE